MSRMPDWTIDEFKTLLAAGGKAPFKVVDQLPDRSAGAISVVQQGIHAFHLGRDHSMLSRMVVDHLKSQAGSVLCRVCGKKL